MRRFGILWALAGFPVIIPFMDGALDPLLADIQSLGVLEPVEEHVDPTVELCLEDSQQVEPEPTKVEPVREEAKPQLREKLLAIGNALEAAASAFQEAVALLEENPQ